MSERESMSIPEFAPTFRFQWEEAQNCYVVLYPEGMVKLSQSAGEILRRCDGQTTVGGIVADLERAFGAPEAAADIKKDVETFIEQAKKNGWLRDKQR